LNKYSGVDALAGDSQGNYLYAEGQFKLRTSTGIINAKSTIAIDLDIISLDGDKRQS